MAGGVYLLMPTSPPIACSSPGCPGRRQAGEPCATCGKGGKREARKRHDEHRGSAAMRGYDWQWQKFRKVYLAEHPLCVDCEAAGIVAAATDIHHVQKLATHPELKYEAENLMPLCKHHHDTRTARGE